MTDLADAVREIIAELDPDGGGYRTSEATGRLYQRAHTESGGLRPMTGHLVRLGCNVAFKQYKPARAMQPHMATAGGVQADMADLGWLAQHTALDEGDTAVRKQIGQLTRAETLQVIALKRKKAAEASAMADHLQRVVDDHPEWVELPELLLADVIDPKAA